MAKTTSAKKAIRVSARRRVFNLRRKKAVKDTLKDVEKLVAAKKGTEAAALLPTVYKAVDKAVKRGVLEKNTGSRIKSKVARSVVAK